jgi:hypothetical protein
MGARDDDSHADAAEECGSESGIDGLAQLLPPDLGQVGEGDADNERGLTTACDQDRTVELSP